MSALAFIFLFLFLIFSSLILSSLPLERLDVWLKVISVVLAGMTVMVGIAAFFTGEKLSDILKGEVATLVKETAGLQKETAEAKQKQAEAELRLAGLMERQNRQEQPRWAYLGKLDILLKDKPKGVAEVLYVSEDEEAYFFALRLADSITSAEWDIKRVALISADDPSQILPMYSRSEFNDSPLLKNTPLLIKVGGKKGITLVAKEVITAPFDENRPSGALALALLDCGFGFGGTRDERLPDGFVRIVVGPKE